MHFDRLSNKHYCVLSNSGLSNATSKRPKFVEKRGNHVATLPKLEFAHLQNRISTSGLSQKQQLTSRPHFAAKRKILWYQVKNCMCNRLRTNKTENEIRTSLKFQLISPVTLTTDNKSTLICYISVRFLWRFVGKYVHHNRETKKIGFCTPLKSEIYFRFVSETAGII